MFDFLKKVFGGVGLFLCAMEGNAVEISSENYAVYKGDLNGDGYSDFYFHPKRKFLILHGDITIPIAYSNPQGFAIYGSFSGGANNYGNPLPFELGEGSLQIKLSTSGLSLASENVDYTSWFDVPSGVVMTRVYAGDMFLNLSSAKSIQLPTLVSVSRRSVVFIHTDLLGSPAAETNQQGN